MNKKAIVILGILALIALSFSLGIAEQSTVVSKRAATEIPPAQIAPAGPPAMARDECYLQYTNWYSYAYYPMWNYGDKFALYFDPEDCGYPENSPFQLTAVELRLFDFAGAGVCSLRFSVEKSVCPYICDGPGIEIWQSRTYDITTFHPDVVTIYFEDIVCVDKPFFFMVEYLQQAQGTVPSLTFDDQDVNTCYQWVWFGGPDWNEWYDVWGSNPPGWAVLRISGLVADQTDCGEWYWKPDTLPQAPSGMPDFDQNQNDWTAFSGPTAAANCLWWFDAVPAGMDPPDLIELLAGYFSTTSSGTNVDSLQAGLQRYFEDYSFGLKAITYWWPDFYQMEDSLKKGQGIILLVGFWWWYDSFHMWVEQGSTYVTMAGVDSGAKEIALSDPARDQCLLYPWWPGRVRTPDHPPSGEYTPTLHNDPQYVSHDAFVSLLYPEWSPDSCHWELADFCYVDGPPGMNVPQRYKAYSKGPPERYWVFNNAVEAAVLICPVPVNHPPYQPSEPSPPDGATGQSINVDLGWSGGDPDPGNTVTYDVYFGTTEPPPLVSPGQPATTYDPGPLNFDTHYFWQIVARDPQGAETLGPVWDFTTKTEAMAWHWKDPYEDYAPNGMPDIDQRQDTWIKEETGQFSFCGPVAVANCFVWFDSKYNVPGGFPGDATDQFPLVRDYLDDLPAIWTGWDDHSPENVEHPGTGWNPGIGSPPLTGQPFVPGPQVPGGGLPPWGELVERLAWFFDTDGIQGPYCNHTGTNILQMQQGIEEWFASEMFENGSSLADSLCEVTTSSPSFTYVESLVEKCEDVILLLGFWFEEPPGSGEWWRIGGHYVTVAGVNSDQFMIALSDPFVDNAEVGFAGRVGDGVIIPHPYGSHDPTFHNDAGNISHDIYPVNTTPISPGGEWWLPDYPVNLDPYIWAENFSAQNVPDEFVPLTLPWNEVSPIFTEVEYCVHISPWDYRGDVNHSGSVEAGDIVYLITYLYRGGPAPTPYSLGDVNCDGVVTAGDIVRLLNYLFRGWPVPRCCDP